MKSHKCQKKIFSRRSYLCSQCQSYDDRQTRPIQRDEKNWKEGERMKEK
jgi:hypothetical protein